MLVEEALRVLRDLPGRIDRPGDPSGGQLVHYESGLSISVWAARDRHVDAVEVWRPERDVRVLFGDLDVFGTPADDLIAALAAVARVDVEHEGAQVTAPDLLLALWRPFVQEDPNDEDGKHAPSLRTVGTATLVAVALSGCLTARSVAPSPDSGVYVNGETGAVVRLEADGTFVVSGLPSGVLGPLEDAGVRGGVAREDLSETWEDPHYDPTDGAADFIYLSPDESMPTTLGGFQLFSRSDDEVYLWMGPGTADRFTFLRDE